MKKQYISPEVLCQKIRLNSLLNGASVTGIDKGDLTHEIETGGEASDGQVSDSRRYSIWDDEDKEEY